MKKKYSKPYLLKENFQVDSTIATCDYAFHYANYDCYAGKEIADYFSDGACFADAINPSESSSTDKICYHGVLAEDLGTTFFAS